MNVRELRSLLEEYDEEVTVRLAFQPQWPLEYDIDSQVALCVDDDPHDYFLAPDGDGDALTRCTLCDFTIDLEAEDLDDAKDTMLVHLRKRHMGEVTACLYLAESNQLGYLPHDAAVQLRWKEK